MKPEDFIAKIAPAAQANYKMTGIPASFTICQAALESGWGSSKTTANANNLFNIKADASWKGPWWSMASTEHIDGKDVLQDARWRLYDDWQAAIDDHAKFFRVNPRYAACFKETTGEGWARTVAAAGYATDPDYANKLIGTMHSHNLQQYDVFAAPIVTGQATPISPPVAAKPAGVIGSLLGIFAALFGKKGS